MCSAVEDNNNKELLSLKTGPEEAELEGVQPGRLAAADIDIRWPTQFMLVRDRMVRDRGS
jgi:hypothetical protein